MDIVPPPVSAPSADNALPENLAIPPPDENPAAPDAKTDKLSPPAAAPKPVTQKKSGNSVTMAIIATVIIVLGLAALAVYAYIKTK
jgi:hypothetical protein